LQAEQLSDAKGLAKVQVEHIHAAEKDAWGEGASQADMGGNVTKCTKKHDCQAY
jgi:hypothetical protein